MATATPSQFTVPSAIPDLERPPITDPAAAQGLVMAQQIIERDPAVLPLLLAHGAAGVQQAFQRYRLVHQSLPQQLEDVTPYTFLWPALPGTSGKLSPARWGAPASYTSRPAMAPERWLETAPGFGIALIPGEGIASAFPMPDEQGLIQYHLRPANPRWLEINPAAHALPQVAAIPAMTPAALAGLLAVEPNPQTAEHRILREYRRIAREPADARVAAAAEQLLHWIRTATLNAQEFPASPSEAAWATSSLPLNLIEAPESAEAAISISWDSQRAFRFQIRYPSGVAEDTVLVFTKLSVEGSTTEEYPLADYMAAKPGAFQPWAQYRLAEHPSFPATKTSRAR